LNGDRLAGEVAVVTGASSGIGAAVARALNAEGASVALAARRERALLGVQSSLDDSPGRRSIIMPTDVTDGEQVSSLVRYAGELEPVEMLVNCAGALYYTMMKNVREEEWERTVEVNCKGAPTAWVPCYRGCWRGRVSSSWRRSPRDCRSRPPAPG